MKFYLKGMYIALITLHILAGSYIIYYWYQSAMFACWYVLPLSAECRAETLHIHILGTIAVAAVALSASSIILQQRGYLKAGYLMIPAALTLPVLVNPLWKQTLLIIEFLPYVSAHPVAIVAMLGPIVVILTALIPFYVLWRTIFYQRTPR